MVHMVSDLLLIVLMHLDWLIPSAAEKSWQKLVKGCFIHCGVSSVVSPRTCFRSTAGLSSGHWSSSLWSLLSLFSPSLQFKLTLLIRPSLTNIWPTAVVSRNSIFIWSIKTKILYFTAPIPSCQGCASIPTFQLCTQPSGLKANPMYFSFYVWDTSESVIETFSSSPI